MSTISPISLDKPNLLCVIPFRGKNLYRKKNIKLVLQWLVLAKDYLKSNYEINMDLCVVEQDRESYDQLPKDQVTHLFFE